MIQTVQKLTLPVGWACGAASAVPRLVHWPAVHSLYIDGGQCPMLCLREIAGGVANNNGLFIERYASGTLVRDGYDWFKLLDDNDRPPLIFHGTSSTLIEGIRENGLDLQRGPLTIDEIKFINAVFVMLGQSSKALMVPMGLCLTFNVFTAVSYALQGPEIVERLIRANEGISKGMMDTLPLEMRSRYESIVERTYDLMKRHSPVVVYMKAPLEKENVYDSLAQSVLFERGALEYVVGLAKAPRLEMDRRYCHRICSPAISNPDIPPRDLIQLAIRTCEQHVNVGCVPPEYLLGCVPVVSGKYPAV